MPDRAVFLFDGPNFYKNLYYARINRGHLDFMKLATQLAGPRQVSDVVYFTSPTDQVTDADNYANQQRFFAAIQKGGVTLKLGKLVDRNKECPVCQQTYSFKTEKSVDVQLALEIALGAAEDRWEAAYVATCDSDIIPAIQFAKSRGKKIYLMLPDGARCYSVANECTASIRITQAIVDSCQV